jgi:17beta-estradiol 17-dehydrogenase / very-long-chain 3-oxoacyl-CoA reductase
VRLISPAFPAAFPQIIHKTPNAVHFALQANTFALHEKSMSLSVLYIFVWLVAGYYGYQLLSFIFQYIYPSQIKEHLTDGAYAMITGATDGIGKALATALGAHGFNLIIHGRNQLKLDAVKQQLVLLYPDIKIATVCQDGSQEPLPDINTIKHLPITVLVNNVGIGPIHVLRSSAISDISDMVNLNILFPTYLTRALSSLAISPTLIINISSYAGILPPPFLSVYAGTKAYNNAFSKSLSVEMPDAAVMSVLVGSVHTGSNQKPVSFMRPDASKFAKCVIRMVGTKKKSVYPYWPHAVQTYLLGKLPAAWMDRTLRKVMLQESKQGI